MKVAIILGIGIAVASPVCAQAQDIDWTGLYGGVEAGVGRASTDVAATDAITQLSNINVPGRGLVVVPGTSRPIAGGGDKSDLVYGAVLGGQWQSGTWIFGLEGGVHGPHDLADVAQSYTLPAYALGPQATVELTRSAKTDYDWSARLRIGYAFGANMVYASGGAAGARVEMTGVDTYTSPGGAGTPAPGTGIVYTAPAIGPVVVTATQKKTMSGWTAGLGGEHRLSDRVGVGVDARYSDLGDHTFALAQGFFPQPIAVGSAPGATLVAPDVVFAGQAPVPYTDFNFVLPGAIPSATTAALTEWQVTARVTWHFGFGR